MDACRKGYFTTVSYTHLAIADAIDSYSRKTGGYLRKEDLAAYKAQWVEPITTNYRGYDVWEIPPNGHGIVVLMALNILEGMDLSCLLYTSILIHIFDVLHPLQTVFRREYHLRRGPGPAGDYGLFFLHDEDVVDTRLIRGRVAHIFKIAGHVFLAVQIIGYQAHGSGAVSYTHLDVYKRQGHP